MQVTSESNGQILPGGMEPSATTTQARYLDKTCCQCGETFLKLGPYVKHREECEGDSRKVNIKPGKTTPYILLDKKKIKSFQCKDCQKFYSSKGSLKRHLRIHAQDKLYQCDYCQKAFTDSSNLKGHIDRNHRTQPMPSNPTLFV